MQYLKLTIEIPAIPNPQQAQVRADLKVEGLLKSIRDEFYNGVQDPMFYLWRKDGLGSLNPHRTLLELGISDYDVLVAGKEPPETPSIPIAKGRLEGMRSEHQGGAFAYLLADNGVRLPLEWMPVVLGRQTAQSSFPTLERVVLDETNFSQVNSISRDHTVIMYNKNNRQYFVVATASGTDGRSNAPNFTYLNGRRLPFDSAVALQAGDELRLGETDIIMIFRLR